MTILNLPAASAVLDRLEAVRARRWRVGVLSGMLAIASLCLGAGLAAAMLAGYWPGEQPPVVLRWTLLACLAGVALFALGWLGGRALLWRQNAAQLARSVEQALPQVGNDLINTVLLAGDAQQASPELVEQAIQEAARRTGKVDLAGSISTRALKRWAVATGAIVVLAGAMAITQGALLRRGMVAIFSPGAYVPGVNALELVSISPEDGSTRLAGQGMTIVAKIRNDAAAPYDGEVVIDGVGARPMLAGEGYSKFTCAINSLDQTVRFSVRIGTSRWPADKPFYTVNVIKQAEIKGLDLKYDYPAYTRIAPVTKTGSDGKVLAPIGTKVTATLRLGSAMPSASLEMPDGSSQAMATIDGGQSFSAVIPVQADGAYRIVLHDSSGRTIQQLPDPSASIAAEGLGQAGLDLIKGYYPIRAQADDPPRIEFLLPGRDINAPPGGKVQLRIRVYDKFGLTDAGLLLDVGSPTSGPANVTKVFHRAPNFPSLKKDKNDQILEYWLDLSGCKKGDWITYRASASDNRQLPGLGTQTTVSEEYKVTIQDSGELAAQKAKRWEELRRRLMVLLATEEAQRVNCEIVVRSHDDYVGTADAAKQANLGKTIVRLSEEMLGAQKTVRAELADLAGNFPFDEDTQKLQGEIASLAGKEAAIASEQARTLVAMSLKENVARQAAGLAGTQDKIISSLQTLLAVMPSMAGKKSPPDKLASRPTELTPEVQDKLRALKTELAKMIADQKKVIQASEALAKKPVDNFTADDEKNLQELKAVQDKWEKFLNEAFADFSKLAEQDFSNPVMMKELISVKSDVTMAKDALSKKATEIATALEDNGIENAKTLTANIEKWLPDKPDREKWSMEDPKGGQDKIEQAELPKELEDLVGDLLEQEEDLFQEMQDQTGKYAQSGDKGIGWDAMDGPISNMNAQGVTGNQLPNSNELSGRSGEGRSGKSSGEFVEDKYVGKGGRRTPTRLTAEPYQKGEVKDESSDPAGGSTGGGKVGGAGGEGLTGPVPPPLQKEMKRLAGQQATLMNKAERLNARFAPSDPAGVKMIEAITLMGRVKRDLDNFRYRNVLRARNDVVGAISQSKLLLTGQIDVSADTSANMPKYIMDDISDAMKGKLPDEYREVLQQYYRRLSEGPK